MASKFYLFLPSNTPGYSNNAPNKFRVHLPKPITFDGTWVCGMHSIIYTHSWPTIGTTEAQYFEIKFKQGERFRFRIPNFSYSSAEQLEKILPSILMKSLREFGIIQFELVENEEVRHKRKAKVRRYRIKYPTTQKEVSDEEESEQLNEDQVSEKINTRKEEIEPFLTRINQSYGKIVKYINDATQIYNEIKDVEIIDGSEPFFYKNKLFFQYNSIDWYKPYLAQAWQEVQGEKEKFAQAVKEKNLKKQRQAFIRLHFYCYYFEGDKIEPGSDDINATITPGLERHFKEGYEIIVEAKNQFLTSKKKYDTQTRVTALEISEKDQQKLDVAKRVSSSLLQEIETSHGQILKYYKDGEFVYKKVKAYDTPSGSELETFKKLIMKLFESFFEYYKNLAETEFKRAQESKAKTDEYYEKKSVKMAQSTTDDLKQIKKLLLGDDDKSDPNSFKGFERRARDSKNRIFNLYWEHFLALRVLHETEKEDEARREAKLLENTDTEPKAEKFVSDILAPFFPSDPAEDELEPPASDDNELTGESTEITVVQKIKPHIIIKPPKETEQKSLDIVKDTRKRKLYRTKQLPYNTRIPIPAKYHKAFMEDIFSNINFKYDASIGKFVTTFNDVEIESLLLSPQFAYILGYKDCEINSSGEIATYSFNLQGGLNSFCVYNKGLTENIIMGNQLVSLLSVVAVQGNHGDTIEKTYDSPVFTKVLPKQIQEIEIEIRTLDGHLVPFQFGMTMLCLVFKKVIVF